jgi:hypothetical protein
MLSTLRILVVAALALAGAVTSFAQATNVSSSWSGGDLYYYDKSGNEIFNIDGTNRALEIPSGSTISIPSGMVDRGDLVEDALQAYPLEPRTVTFAALGVSEAAGTFNWGLGTNLVTLNGEVTDNETEVSVGYFTFTLPPEYVAAGDVKVRFRSALVVSASPTNNGSTLDLECYEQADAAVGADLVSTAAVTYAALSTWYSKDFTVTATPLVAGDILVCKYTTSIVDSEAGGGTITWKADTPKILLDVKG